MVSQETETSHEFKPKQVRSIQAKRARFIQVRRGYGLLHWPGMSGSETKTRKLVTHKQHAGQRLQPSLEMVSRLNCGALSECETLSFQIIIGCHKTHAVSLLYIDRMCRVLYVPATVTQP